MTHLHRDAAKVIKVINSCQTDEQLGVAAKMADNYEKMYGRSEVIRDQYYSACRDIMSPLPPAAGTFIET